MTTAGTKRAEARRAAKEAVQAKAKEQALKDSLVRKEDVLAKNADKPKTPAPKLTRREQVRHDQGKAEGKAEQDSKLAPPTADQIVAGYTGAPGEPIPLQVLNARAEQINKQERDEARILANAAGKSVYDTLQSIAPRSKHGKFRKMREMAVEIAKRDAKDAK